MFDAANTAKMLDLPKPWFVSDITINHDKQEVVYTVDTVAEKMPCPLCNKLCKRYDNRRSRWRHLKTLKYQSYVECSIPRVNCAEHGIRQVNVPWADTFARYTYDFECLVIDLLHDSTISAAAKRAEISWNAASKIMTRAVERGQKRKKKRLPEHLSIDETAFQKRHEYVSIISDQETGAVEFTADGRDEQSVHPYFESLVKRGCKRLKTVSMDMWEGYINAVEHFVEDAESKICFDKFHVAQHIGKGLDTVRRNEHRQLMSTNVETLKGTKYLWLTNPENMDKKMDDRFRQLRKSSLKTAEAWALKEHAMMLWNYVSRTWATKAWLNWIGLVRQSGFEPMIKAATTIANRLWGIINSIIHRRTNALAESINIKIQRAKTLARGYRNRQRFKMVIFFYCGQLDMYP